MLIAVVKSSQGQAKEEAAQERDERVWMVAALAGGKAFCALQFLFVKLLDYFLVPSDEDVNYYDLGSGLYQGTPI